MIVNAVSERISYTHSKIEVAFEVLLLFREGLGQQMVSRSDLKNVIRVLPDSV